MKQSTITDIQRLEKKINLINDKLDRIMEAKGIEFKRAPEGIDKEEEKKRRVRERQQAKILQKENGKRVFERIVDDTMLVFTHGLWIQKEFNLLQKSSGSRIREYLETNNPKAFDGLRRNNK